MKERPILFSAPMVRAILAGTKTQTRRLVKTQPTDERIAGAAIYDEHGQWVWLNGHDGSIVSRAGRCPYGAPSDRLWVREEHYAYGRWVKNGTTKTGRQKYRFELAPGSIICFDRPEHVRTARDGQDGYYKRLGRFMPKSAARIWLQITGVRVERLQDISGKDILAEGAVDRPHRDQYFGKMPVSAFDGKAYLDLKSLWAVGWESINGMGSWGENPWVWVIEFEHVQQDGGRRPRG